MTGAIKKLWTEESGQGLAEYGLILGLVAIVVVLVLTGLGQKLVGVFTTITTDLP